MRKWSLTLLLALISMVAFAQSSPGSDSLNDPIFSFMGNGGYDALEYTIDLKFSSDKKSVTGSSTMTANATQDLSSFNLDFGAMTVTAVRVDGRAAKFEHGDPELKITPAQGLLKGKSFQVSVEYNGQPGTVVPRAKEFGAWNVGAEGLVALGEPSLMFTWAAVNDHPSDKALFTLKLTSGKNDLAIANGTQLSRLENADGTATTTYRIGTPTATYFVVLAIGNWRLEEGPKLENVRVRSYFAANTPDRMRQAIAQVPKILKFYNGLLGPYPFPEAGVLTYSGNFFPGLETQGLVSIPNRYAADYELDYNTEIIAHEFAHQWFGALLTFKTHRDIFVHEGFAQYLGWLYAISSFPVGLDYVERNIRAEYPSFVNAEWTFAYPRKPEFLSALRQDSGDQSMSKPQIATALGLIFSKSMPVLVRDLILAEVDAQGWTINVLISRLDQLKFSRVVISARNLEELHKLSGGNQALEPVYRYTPPGKLTPSDNLFNSGVYNRGAAALHALRLRIGDDRFWKLVRSFLDAYRFGNASNQDWLELVQAQTDAATRAFHEHWLMDDLVPDFPELGLKAEDFKIGSDLKP
jgi:aminopeptidase N